MDSTLDLVFLREMMGNDEAVVHKFLNIFRAQCPRQLEELKAHLNHQDWPGISQVAHSLKTQFKYLGSESLALQAYEIELQAEQEKTEQLAQCIQTFENDLNDLLNRLETSS